VSYIGRCSPPRPLEDVEVVPLNTRDTTSSQNNGNTGYFHAMLKSEIRINMSTDKSNLILI